MDYSLAEATHDIVIVGAGICGLSTALAIHRKGFKSIVLEKSEDLRTTGAAIGVRNNGWLALEHLGVASQLRHTAIPLQRARNITVDNGIKEQVIPEIGECRCLKRSDLVKALADALPSGTVHFGCEIVSIKMDQQNMYPILELYGGKIIRAKILIGCDGSRSVVGDFLELKPTKVFALSAVRGFTSYANAHALAPEVKRTGTDGILVGQIPMSDKTVYWFVTQQYTPSDERLTHDPETIKTSTLDTVKGFPTEITEMIKEVDEDSLSLTHLRYRAPWDLLFDNFRKGTITVAGDSMHVMGPFLGQGGSAGIEDAVVLARNLAQKIKPDDLSNTGRQILIDKVGEAFDQYVKERRMRVVTLSTNSYLIGLLLGTKSRLVKFAATIFMAILFGNSKGHTEYDCGHL